MAKKRGDGYHAHPNRRIKREIPGNAILHWEGQNKNLSVHQREGMEENPRLERKVVVESGKGNFN
jgi:hypothetical protein